MIEQIERAPEQQRAPARYVDRRTYRVLATRTHEEQARLLEQLRYRSYSAASLSQRIMQRLGDFGREYLPFVAAIRWRF